MSGFLVGMRRRLISAPMLSWYRRLLPPMSDTEREAIEAGTVWWDGDLFSGRPDWDKLRTLKRPELSAPERAFLDGPTEELCRMLDDWKITQEGDLPRDVWRFIKDKGFLGMIIPKEYGGLGFSALAHSSIVMKISSRSLTTPCRASTTRVIAPRSPPTRAGRAGCCLPMRRGSALPRSAGTASSWPKSRASRRRVAPARRPAGASSSRSSAWW